MTKKSKNKCILELASSEEDIAILNTKLIDFITSQKKIDQVAVENMVAHILILCRNSPNVSLETASVSLATSLYMIYNKSSSVCLRDHTPIPSSNNFS